MKIAFSPSHTIPYIEPSADPVLQSRLFSYPDTQRHRLGANYQQLPANEAKESVKINNFQRDGPATIKSQGSWPNYQSSIRPLRYYGAEGTLEQTVRDEERFRKHEAFIGGAWRDLAVVTERELQFHIFFYLLYSTYAFDLLSRLRAATLFVGKLEPR